MPALITDMSVALGLLALLLVGLEAGFRTGLRASDRADPRAGAQVGAVQGAVLGLLGLLLAFSFAAAGARFLERQDLITAEANAIGTAYLRADLLADPARAELKQALKSYTEHRVAVSARLRAGVTTQDFLDIERQHTAMWEAAVRGVSDRPHAVLAVLQPVNEVIDLHSLRVAAGRKNLPPIVTGLLIACSFLAVGVIGYGCGLGQSRRAILTVSLALLISTALWITIDLDRPRAGLMKLSDAPLKALRFGE